MLSRLLILVALFQCVYGSILDLLHHAKSNNSYFDNVDSNVRRMIFENLSLQELYQAHKAPLLKHYIEENLPGFKHNSMVKKKCQKRGWKSLKKSDDFLESLYGVNTSPDGFAMSLDSTSDKCLKAVGNMCNENKRTISRHILPPFTVSIHDLKKISKLSYLRPCSISVLIKYADHFLKPGSKEALITELTSDNNQIFELTVDNPRAYHRVPSLIEEITESFKHENNKVKSLNLKHVLNSFFEQSSLSQSLRNILDVGSNVREIALDSFYTDNAQFSEILTEGLVRGHLDSLKIDGIGSMVTLDEVFWHLAPYKLQSLTVESEFNLMVDPLIMMLNAVNLPENMNKTASLKDLSWAGWCDSECAHNLAKLITQLPNLESLDISYNMLYDKDMVFLLEYLALAVMKDHWFSLKHLSIKGNRVTYPKTMRKLLELITMEKSKMETLRMSFLDIGQIEEVLKAIERGHTKLKILELHFPFRLSKLPINFRNRIKSVSEKSGVQILLT